MTTFLNLYGIEVILNEKKVPAKASARKKKIILIFFFQLQCWNFCAREIIIANESESGDTVSKCITWLKFNGDQRVWR